MTTGLVYLIGAGPGDPGLITVRGRDCLRRSEVVVYDYLANPRLLDEVPVHARRIYVGKTSGRHHLPQEQINALLVELACQGRIVARLKGGDPCVFGRGGEEACQLAAAGIPFEIVPGVTAAFGAALYAGIPLTHRDFTTSLGLFTGHEHPARQISSLDWAKLATGVGTLVFYMGMANLEQIAALLMAHGRHPDTPAAVIRWGTLPEQQTLVAPLREIAAQVRRSGLRPPAIIIVGEVVALRDQLRWFDLRPLFGRRILVTRSQEQAGALSAALEAAGARVLAVPTLEIVPPPDWTDLDGALDRLAGTDFLVLTSANAVESLLARLAARNLDSRALAGIVVAAIGRKTAAALAGHGILADLQPARQDAEGMLEMLLEQGVAGGRILYPRSQLARPLLVRGLTAAGAEVLAPVAYHCRCPAAAAEPLRQALDDGVDAVAFASSSALRHAWELLDAGRRKLLQGAVLASLGPQTSATARELGLAVSVEADEPTAEALVAALGAHFSALSSAARS